MSTYEERLRALGVNVPTTTPTTTTTVSPSVTLSTVAREEQQPARKLLVIGGSTRLNRFAAINSTPTFRGVNKSALTSGSSAPSVDAMVFDRVSLLLNFPPDVLCNTFRFLSPKDLQNVCGTGNSYSKIPHDNYLWYKLTVQRFKEECCIRKVDQPQKEQKEKDAKEKKEQKKGSRRGGVTTTTTTATDTATASKSSAVPRASSKKIPPMSSARNWRDEYEYFLAEERRSQKYKMAQMQGNLGRLPPIPSRKNRPVVNFFTNGSAASSSSFDNVPSAVDPNAPTQFCSTVLVHKLDSRQGSGASMWSALRRTTEEPEVPVEN